MRSEEKVPVKILRDTAAFDSFIQASELPFSEESATGSSVPVLGVGMRVLQVPLHKVILHSDLIQGQVAVGVCPALPIEGITFILGNGVAGGRVWADGPPPSPVVSSVPLVRNRPDDSEVNFPEVFTACAVMHAMVRANAVHEGELNNVKHEMSELYSFSLSDIPISVLLEDLKVEQRADPSLSALFEQVVPAEEVNDSSHGYFVHNEVLVKKWVLHGDSFICHPIIQIVVPAKFREVVLKLAHDEAGHWGVR